MSNLAGLHDIEATAIAIPDTWVVDTIALSENPQPKTYPKSLNIIARLNFGYGSTGTLPVSSEYNAFAQTVAMHVSSTLNCKRWIIANECNLSREWPNKQPIYPWDYAACYKLCRQAIHALPGHERDEVLVAGSGPWNAELKYSDNPNGDWITYFSDVIDLCGNEQDGFALHAYTHSYDAALVSSTARMASPFESRHYEFRTYQDYCNAIPDRLSHLPCYITEANGNGPWQAVGLMSAMLAEIDDWNRFSGLPLIQCVAFYRYPHYDDFFIEGRADVIAEYQAAVARGYESPLPVPPWPEPPQPTPAPEPTPPQPTPEPTPPGSPLGTEPPRDIDPDLIERGVIFTGVELPAGTGYWRIIYAAWLEDAAAQVGPDHHILGQILRDGVETAGVPLRVDWPSGDTVVTSKADDANAAYNYDFAMSASLNEYDICVADGNPSDIASGIGMGKDGNPKEHTSTWITFEWTISEGEVTPIPPEPEPAPQGKLIWPVAGPITQPFGANPTYYAQYKQAGHDGIDIGVPEGTPVVAIADGEVMYTGWDDDYGNYCRVYHAAIHSHSFYAHLVQVDVEVGWTVEQGERLGASGNTGNSSGDHLHLELRAGNRDGYYEGVTYGYTSGRYNPVDAYVVTGSALSPGAGL